MVSNTYEIAQAVSALETIPLGETIIAPLNAWFGLDEMNAPITLHYCGVTSNDDEEVVVISGNKSFPAWAVSEVMDDVHMTNAVRSERSTGTRMAISFGMSRGKTSQAVKAAYLATFKRIA
jgi:hypothetical protein|tara:strand:+ start:382 stop:744 length:363 start_codon:yes stop_codon:yes gene_type:complete